jgi:hypothetical protein
MRLVQELVTERLLGRVFGLKDVLENVAFVSAFVGAGALLTLAGVRVVFVGAGVLTVGLAALAAASFRAHHSDEIAPDREETAAAENVTARLGMS